MTPAPRSYAEAMSTFDASVELNRLAMDALEHANAAEICCDRHVDGATLALRHRDLDGQTRDWKFVELQLHPSALARVLSQLGVSKGDRVASLLPRTPELLITILAVWRLGAVYQPMFTAFGPKAIEYRLTSAKTKACLRD